MWQTILKLALALVAYFSPVKEVFILMIGFVAADLITGIVASRYRQIPRSSRRLRKSVVKVACYIAAVLLAFWAEKALAVEWFASHRLIACLICVVEFISILENLAVISGHPVFIKIIKLIRGKASQDDVIHEIINEKNELFDSHSSARSVHFGRMPDASHLDDECGNPCGRHCEDCRNRPRHSGADQGRQQHDPGTDRMR